MSLDPSKRYPDRIESGSRHYNNPYRQDLWARNSYQASVARGRDQLETHNQRVERQLIEKFQKNNFKLMSGGFTAMVHLGKGIVLILVAPPYFMLFVMPRWAFYTLAPAAEKMGEVIEKSFMRVSAWTVDIFGVFSTKIAEFRSRMKKPKKEPKPRKETELDPRLVVMQQRIHAGLKSVRQVAKAFSDALVRMKNRLFDQVNHLRKQAVNHVIAMAQTVRQKLQDAIQYVQVRLVDWMRPKLETAAKVFAALDRTLEKAVHVVSAPVKRVFEVAAKVVQPVVHAAVVTTQFMQALIAPPMQFLMKQTSKAAEAGQKVASKATSALQKGMSVVAQSFNVLAQSMFRPVANAAVWVMQAGEKGVVNGAQKLLNLSKTVAAVMKRAIESCLEKGKQQAKRFLQWTGNQVIAGGKMALAAIMTLKHVPGYLWRMVKWVLKLAYRGWRKVSHSIRVMYVLTKHLVGQSLVQLERSLHKTQ